MARKFLTPLQDTSIYEEFPFRNAGFDEILEVGKTGTSKNEPVRSLIQWDMSAISSSMVNGSLPFSMQFFLNLRIANAVDFVRNQTIELWTVSESWDEGTGAAAQDLTNPQDGASWTNRTKTQLWEVTGSTTGSLIASYSFSWMPSDIRLDITAAVVGWISGTVSGTNNGLLLKLPAAVENDDTATTNLKFFSRNTHTVFPPTLEAIWVDQVFNTTGNCGLAVAGDEFDILLPDFRPSYVTGSTARIRVNARQIQPIKTFADRFRFSNDFFLQSGSMYGIIDDANKGVVIPFDSGSLISADNTGSYFNLKIENMFINRKYRLMIQVPKTWGIDIIDTGHTFKVTG